MTEPTKRQWWPSRPVQRAVHLGLATVLGVFLYSPLGPAQGSDLVLQVIVFPLLTLLGLFTWKYFGWRGRAGVRYWTALFSVLATMVITQHFGPTASEPPADVVGPYESQLLGSVALGWLLVFTLVVVGGLLYSGVLRAGRRDSRTERTHRTRGRR